MANLTIQSEVYQGKLSDMARNAIIQTLRSMEGREVEVVIKEKKRSIKQNKYRWGVVVAEVTRWMNEYLERMGQPLAAPEDIDIFIKDKALGIVHRIETPMGELVITGRLKDKTTATFEESMECIRAYFAEKGLLIPLPRENLNEGTVNNLKYKD